MATSILNTSRAKEKGHGLMPMYRRGILVVVALAAAVVLAAAFSGHLAAQSDPFLGVWEMNHAKSSITRGTAPLSEMVVIVAEAGGLKSTLMMINGGEGRAEVHHYRFDGNPHPTEGGDPRHLSFRRTGPRSAEIIVIRSGQVTATRRMDVSGDGMTLSFNASGTSANGTPYTNDLRVYERKY